MSLFLMTGVPLAFFVVLSASSKMSTDVWKLGSSFLRGVAVFLIVIPIYLVLESFIHIEYQPARIFYYYFFIHTVVHAVCIVAGYVVFERKKNTESDERRLLFLLAFAGGFYVLLPALDIILLRHQLDAYSLFLLPAIRIVCALSFSALVYLFEEHGVFVRILSLLAVIAVATLLTFIPYLYIRSFATAAYALTGSMIIVAVGLVFSAIRFRTW